MGVTGDIQMPQTCSSLGGYVYWADTYHFKEAAINLQAEMISEHVLSALGLKNAEGKLRQESSETGPSGALR